MKSSASIATALTLLMFILVLAAAVFFLFQGQNELKGELATADENNKTLRDQQAEMELNEHAVAATLETIQNIHATSAVENVELEGQLSESEQAKATLEALTAQQTFELETANSAVNFYESLGPLVTIIEPREGAILIEGQPVEIVIVASDPVGIATINYNIDNELFFETVEEEGSVFTLRNNWTPTATGPFKLTASAINGKQITSQPSQFSEVDFTVDPMSPTDTPDSTETTTPEATTEGTPEATLEGTLEATSES